MSYRSVKHFARSMLKDERLRMSPNTDLMKLTPGKWMEVILHREGNYQVQLSVIFPDVVVPRHKHLRCESMDICLAGSGSEFNVDGWRGFRVIRGSMGANLGPVPVDVCHGGKSEPRGTVLVSFQHWLSGEPAFITDDWAIC